ncbi:MAG: 30S ribosomal protein S20 [Thiotrichaceae bacterium]|nr:30S ribosomal protein S20 [Thiotrichaceae bacterium]
MANSAQAKKRAIQAEKHRQLNASQRSMLRTYVKKVLKAIAAKDAEQAQAAYKVAVPVIDGMANKGLIHKNKAARHKSRLNAHIHALQA